MTLYELITSIITQIYTAGAGHEIRQWKVVNEVDQLTTEGEVRVF